MHEGRVPHKLKSYIIWSVKQKSAVIIAPLLHYNLMVDLLEVSCWIIIAQCDAWLRQTRAKHVSWTKHKLRTNCERKQLLYLWDLEQTFAPFPAIDPSLSFTYATRIKLTVDAQAQSKEMFIFSCENGTVWTALAVESHTSQTRLLNSWKSMHARWYQSFTTALMYWSVTAEFIFPGHVVLQINCHIWTRFWKVFVSSSPCLYNQLYVCHSIAP